MKIRWKKARLHEHYRFHAYLRSIMMWDLIYEVLKSKYHGHNLAESAYEIFSSNKDITEV